jgi:hypothetical protein
MFQTGQYARRLCGEDAKEVWSVVWAAVACDLEHANCTALHRRVIDDGEWPNTRSYHERRKETQAARRLHILIVLGEQAMVP